jgi:hypothetical protein
MWHVYLLLSNSCVNGRSTIAVSRKQICGHIFSPATREQAIMEETFLCSPGRGYITRTVSWSRIWDSKIWLWVLKMTALTKSPAFVNNRSVLSSERVSKISIPATVWRNKNLVLSPKCVLDTKTDWPTDRQSQHNFECVSCEKWEASSWGRGQCGNPEEGERPSLKPLPSNG